MWPASARQSDTLLDAVFAVSELVGQSSQEASDAWAGLFLYLPLSQALQAAPPSASLYWPAAQALQESVVVALPCKVPVNPAEQWHEDTVELPDAD